MSIFRGGALAAVVRLLVSARPTVVSGLDTCILACWLWACKLGREFRVRQ
jgi:hypothetical protein